MSKKSKLLAAGVLSALALVALPTVASAGEYEMHCPVAPCIGTVSGTAAQHPIRFENDKGERFEITAIDGSIAVNQSTTTTATTELSITGFHEKISGFKFTCHSPGALAGEVKTGPIPLHFVNLAHGGTKPGVLLTNINITITCAGGLVIRTITGNLIGTLTEAKCNIPAPTHKITFNITSGVPGTQEHEQVTTTGTFYDLTSGSHPEDTTTSALTAQLGIIWNQSVTLTC